MGKTALDDVVLLDLPAGVHDGARVMLVASAAGEVAAVQHARELPGLAGFDHELLRAARRRRVHAGHAGGILTAPTGKQRSCSCI